MWWCSGANATSASAASHDAWLANLDVPGEGRASPYSRKTVHGPSCLNSDLNRVSRSVDSVVNTSSQISEVAAIALQCSIFVRWFAERRRRCAIGPHAMWAAIGCFYGRCAIRAGIAGFCAGITVASADICWMMEFAARAMQHARDGCVTGRLLTTLSTRSPFVGQQDDVGPAATYQENA